jgi:hypothetical protein
MFEEVTQTPPAAPSRHPSISIKVSSIKTILINHPPFRKSIDTYISRIPHSTHFNTSKMPRATAGKPNFLFLLKTQKTNIRQRNPGPV